MLTTSKKMITALTLLLTLTGCFYSGPGEDVQVNSEPAIASAEDSRDYGLSSLVIELPEGWELDKGDKLNYLMVNERGEAAGRISSSPYEANYEFNHTLPNHSSVIDDETIQLPAGACRLITLDADNGPAASGKTGTHNTYYGVVSVQDKVIYILDFTNLDKDPKSKQQFIDILNTISIKEPDA
ncbi:hypothetical protein [Paenibacillus sp. FSL R7-0273]|uniref:hypothetical protein n=1 Tax=Paenibacillus sp. FSL R7-0273 TaxID=1536772 RepID=UPI000AD4E5CA|nr:hypothetical protein [Paenibacillus sp. FSL R7-0273]